MNRIVLTLWVAAILVATGCGKKTEDKVAKSIAEKLIEKGLAAQGVKAKVNLSGENGSFTTLDADGQEHTLQIEGEGLTVKGPDGVTTFRSMGAGHMPEDFPQDVFVYPGARVVSSMSFPNGNMLALESSATLRDIITTVTTEMQAKGWTQKSSMDMGETAMLTFGKDTRATSMIIQSDNNLTTIQITVAAEEK